MAIKDFLQNSFSKMKEASKVQHDAFKAAIEKYSRNQLEKKKNELENDLAKYSTQLLELDYKKSEIELKINYAEKEKALVEDKLKNL